MQIKNHFDFKRLYLLIKKDFYTQYKTYLIGLGAIFSILYVVNISSVASYNSWNFHLVFFPLTLFIGGFIFTSLSFRELDNERSLIFYLTLPASNLEKFISKLLISSIGYVLVSLVLYFLFSLTAFVFCTLIFGYAHQIFNPFHHLILTCICLYFVTQSIFLSGAVYFRGNTFIKTILSVFVLAVLYQVFIVIIAYLLYSIITYRGHIYFSYGILNNIFQEESNNSYVVKGISEIRIFVYIAKVLFWFVLAPLMWVIAFFRLKESEI